MVVLIIIILLFLAYSVLIISYFLAWRAIPFYKVPIQSTRPKISVIIPARNEEKNIGSLLLALQNQSYPADSFEVIVIDDHSTDATSVVVKQFPKYQLIQLKDENINSYKKKAIETGILASNAELVITTDADCVPGSKWLENIAAFKTEKDAILVVAPVSINCNSSILQVFQAMDFMVLQGITGATLHLKQLSMCNGANLSYEKQAFIDVNGFEGIDHIASGDDMLLMHKIGKQFPGRVHYLKSKEAIVSTAPAQTWNEFFQQRIRWASKAGKYQDKAILPVLLLVYLLNLSFLVLLIAGFWDSSYWIWLLVLLIAKTLVELPLFVSVSSFFDKAWATPWFFVFQPLHILYTIIAGLFGQFGKYKWKGRKVY